MRTITRFASVRIFNFTGSSHVARAFQFFQLPLHQLQMDVQGVERISDLMGDAGGKQGQRLDALGFDGRKGLFPRFGRIMDDQRQPGTARRLSIQGRDVQAQEARARKCDLQFVASDSLAAGGIGGGKLLPIQFRQVASERLAFNALRFQPKESSHRLIEIKDSSAFIDHQHAILDCVKKRL
jgi:hypothetical protein